MLGGLEACGQAACGSILRSLRANDFRVAAGRAFSAPVLGGSRWIEFLRAFGSLSFEVARGAVVDPTGMRLVVSGWTQEDRAFWRSYRSSRTAPSATYRFRNTHDRDARRSAHDRAENSLRSVVRGVVAGDRRMARPVL
jgi:hypothetical protein